MALTNKERIGRMLDGLAAGLKPVVEQAFSKAYGATWVSTVEAAKGTGMLARPIPMTRSSSSTPSGSTGRTHSARRSAWPRRTTSPSCA